MAFPQTEIGTNPEDIARFGTAAEEIGYDHVVVFDHVLGANPASRPDWHGAYTSESQFYEPFVLFGYLAGLTRTLEFVTAVLILPQRQTALVAKQAACVDVLSRGRLRLGIGTGWNDVEYEALGENFRNRGVRSEEQIEVMRRLWAQDTIKYEGRWHRIPDAGLNPLPPGRSIPVWLGGMAPQVLDRVARLADGWFPFYNDDLESQIQAVRAAAREAGRNPDDIGVECIQPMGDCGGAELDRLKSLRDMGVTHTSVITMSHGLAGPSDHIDAIRRYWDSVASKL
ncbi:MAG: LLM class F420-dependent oxidoreductase [Gammaproteobacteria bacterium]|nr:LLM class F420-dependent oxidoreductase [Gammaproteobacteria bacterium]